MPTLDAIILGAGLSGLVTAFDLHRAGLKVLVLDRRSTPGGRIISERMDGFLMEHGPTSMTGPAPEAETLIASLGLEEGRVARGEGVRHRYLLRDGAIRSLPMHPLGFFTSNFFSLSARLRLLAEPFIPVEEVDETVATFVRRRLGQEWLDYVFDPLVGGLHAGDPERVSMAALLPRLKSLERRHGSLARGVAASRRRGVGVPGGRTLFSFREGLATLPHTLAAALGDRLRLGVRVEGVRPGAGGGFMVTGRRQGETMRWWTPRVVVALPAYAAARVLEPLSPSVAETLDAIPHPPLAVVFLGYEAGQVGHPLDGLGYLAPRIEGRSALGMIFSSTLFPGRAPQGAVALTAFVGGARQPELASLPTAELERLTVGESRALLDARGAPVLTRTRVWPRGLPQYELGHTARMERVQRLETDHPGLFVTGNYLAGVSTTACIEQARLTAARLVGLFSLPANDHHGVAMCGG